MRYSHFTAIYPNYSQRSRRVAAWLGICAVLLHTGLLFSQSISMPWLSADKEPAYLLLCSAFGSKTVPIDNQKDSSTSQNSKRCPVCQLYALGKTSLPMASLLLSAVSPYFANVLLGFSERHLPRQPFSVASPRGPPL